MGQQLITDVGCFTTSTKDKINANFTELYNSGGGAPGGADTQVQFNDAGSFGGDAGLTFDKTTATLGNTMPVASDTPAPAWNILIAPGNGAAAGGDLNLTAGAGGADNTGDNNGGGFVTITAGSGHGYAGDVTLIGGDSFNGGGGATLRGGSSDGAAGGTARMNGGASSFGSGGGVVLVGGDTSANAQGGGVDLIVGLSSGGGAAGDIRLLDVNSNAALRVVGDTGVIVIGNELDMSDGMGIKLSTTDPHVAGTLWNNGGTPTISAG